MNWRERLERYGISPRDVTICALLSIGGTMALGVWVDVIAAVFSGVLGFGMLLITVTDSRRMLIPDVVSMPMIPLGVIASIACLPGAWTATLGDHVFAAVVAAGGLYGLRWAYFKLRAVVGLGLGDVKIAAVAGSWLGFEQLPTALLLASCAALVATLLRSCFNTEQRLGAGTAVPFGSFLAPAILFGWILLLIRV